MSNNSDQRLVIVGASLAGLRAAEAARADGFNGAITLIGEEVHHPHDRPSLSKEFLAPGGISAPLYHKTGDALAELGIDLVLGDKAVRLDTAAEVVSTATGDYRFTAAVIATGSRPVTLPGSSGLAGVFCLRNLEEAKAIRSALDQGARTVVIGGGFIGAEVASAARARNLPVTIVEAAEVPLVRAMGTDMGRVLASLHARHGTDLQCGVAVSGLEGDGRVEQVVLTSGQRLAADLVVLGIGSRPAVSWLETSGLELNDGVVCDEFLRTSHPTIFAAGDVARWNNALFGRTMRMENVTAAGEQGARAGRNAINPACAQPYVTVPYFWSDWYGHRVQSVGVVTDDYSLVSGDFAETHFVVLYRGEGDRVVGALTLNGQSHIMKYRRMIADGAAFDEALAFAASRRQTRRLMQA